MKYVRQVGGNVNRRKNVRSCDYERSTEEYVGVGG